VAIVLERRLDERVLANRVRFHAGGWSLEPFADALARTHTGLARLPQRSLLTDVADFYGSVRPEIAEITLLEAGVTGHDARRIRSQLEGWEHAGGRGLPIGPPGSAVVANAVLLRADRALGARPFLRWVDDYRIAVASEEDRDRLVARLDEELAALGLRRCERKTRMAVPGDRWPGSASATGA
jgi:hypothetical protein